MSGPDVYKRQGIQIDTVAYSPGSVADYTLMLILMLVRGTKSILRGAERFNYRLNNLRGKELGDMTVGVVGTGRIGQDVYKRQISWRRGLFCS